MPSIFPESTAGGVAIRDPAGNPTHPAGVENAYAPPATFASTCQFTALPSDCTARWEPRQANAIVSELVRFAECLSPGGPWNCSTPDNLCNAFSNWFLTSGVGNKVNRTGDTMTGMLTLALDPVNPMDAATKEYVDNGLSGILSFANGNYVKKSGDTMTGPLLMAGPPSNPNEVATKAYVDASGVAPGSYVQKSGDTMSGNLTIAKDSPYFILQKLATGSNTNAILAKNSTGVARWQMELGNAAAETGGNNGSNFVLTSYNDAGVGLNTPIVIQRVDSLLTYNGGANINGNVLINGKAGNWGLQVVGGLPSPTYGLRVVAGSNSNDYPFMVTNQTGGTSYFQIDGTGKVVIPMGAQKFCVGTPATSFNSQVVFRYNSSLTGGMEISDTYFGDGGTILGIVNGNNTQAWSWTWGGGTQRQINVNGVWNYTADLRASGNLVVGANLLVNLGAYITGNINVSGSGTIGTNLTVGAGADIHGATINIIDDSGSAMPSMNLYSSTSRIGRVWAFPTDASIRLRNEWAGAGHQYDVAIDYLGRVTLGVGFAGRPGASSSTDDLQYHNAFWDGSGNVGWFVGNAFMGYISFTSDYRIKKDVVNLDSKWDAVKALRPIRYTQAEYNPPGNSNNPRNVPTPKGVTPQQAKATNDPLFKADNIERWGFIAHELQATLLHSAATGVKDDPVKIQTPNPWAVIAALTKALQEAMTRIETLETLVASRSTSP